MRLQKKPLVDQAFSCHTSTYLIYFFMNCGIEVKIVSKSEYTVEVAAHADAVFSAGGDGTFLMAAEKIRDHRAVVGFNTDPMGYFIRSLVNCCSFDDTVGIQFNQNSFGQ